MLTLLRPDRDDFININEDNIEPGLKKNFVKRAFGTADYGVKGSVNTRNSPYDVNSEPKIEKGCDRISLREFIKNLILQCFLQNMVVISARFHLRNKTGNCF